MKLNLMIRLIMIMMVIAGVAPDVRSAAIEGVSFKNAVIEEDIRLSLRGKGLFRYLGFLKAYVGALYLEEGKPTEDVLSDSAKRLEIEYFHNIKGEDFGAVTTRLIAQNTDSQTFERLLPRIEKFNQMYEDVEPGDRYSLTYIPGKGTELALNGKSIGVIDGADFASAVYAIWLGQNPINQSFKQQLMGSP
jgi:hypothetical protein